MSEKTPGLGERLLFIAALGVVPAAAFDTTLLSGIFDLPAVLAVLLSAGYLAAVVLFAFLSSTVSQLMPRWTGRAAEALDRHARYRFTGFEGRYLRLLHTTHRYIDLKGLGYLDHQTPLVEEVFVDVCLTPRPLHEAAQEGPAAPARSAARVAADDSARRSIGDFIGKEAGSVVAVIGAPGTGKTTLLKRLALQRSPQRRDLPVLLLLRDHAAAIAANPRTSLPEVIRASLNAGITSGEPPGWLEQQLDRGRCLVLLDGLDEVANQDERHAVSRWVERQIASYDRNDFVLTSRPHGYAGAPVSGARVLAVQRLTEEQIHTFVHRWYRTTVRQHRDEKDAELAERVRAQADDLLARLRDRPALLELAVNPMLLTMIVNVHRHHEPIPDSRADLYEEICKVLLWRRRERQGVRADASAGGGRGAAGGRQTATALRDLAFAMMRACKRDISEDEAETLLHPVLKQLAVTDEPADFLASAVASGLLVERDVGVYGFAHLTLQSYLAARHIETKQLTGVLCDAVDDDWWRDTTLLFATRVDPAPVIEACLASGTTNALALAFDCEEVADVFDPTVKARLLAERSRALTEPDPARRRLFTAVTVVRWLRESFQLTPHVQVSARAVPENIWQLFRHPEGLPVSPATGLSPDPSPDPSSAPSADLPAVGVPGPRAADFVRWVNGLLPDGPGYRLPTPEEAADQAFRLTSRSPEHTVWCAGPDPDAPDGPELHVPDGAAHPWAAALPSADGWPDEDSATVLRAGRLGQARTVAAELAAELDTAHFHALNLRHAPTLRKSVIAADAKAARLERDLHQGGNARLHLDPATDARLHRGLSAVAPLVHQLVHDIDRARHTDLVADVDQSVARSRARELAGELDRIRALAHQLARHPALARLAEDLHGASLIHGVLHHLDPPGRLARAADGPVPAGRRAAATLRAHLARHTGAPRTVPPDALREALAAATRRLPTYLTEGEDRPSPRTTPGALAELAGYATALADSPATAPGTPGPLTLPPATDAAPDVPHAVHLQLAALTLATAADRHLADPELAALYRTAATGATILRHRAEGTFTPTETLVLAWEV